MGAYSSTAYFADYSEFNHQRKRMTCNYEKDVSEIKFIRDIGFFIEDVIPILSKKDLFRDNTLILDIDLTLGEAIIVDRSDTKPDKITLLNKEVDSVVVYKLIEKEKAYWFHNGSCCFFIRPYFKEFVTFCVNNFKEVVIWTNGVQKHADDMCHLIYKMTGRTLRGFGRYYSSGTNQVKVVSKIGLDPSKTWMVDDDHRHHCKSCPDPDHEVNSEIKFFHTPEFSVSALEQFFESKIYDWAHPNQTIELYDDWFLFLIWNWHYMHLNDIKFKSFLRKENKFLIEE